MNIPQLFHLIENIDPFYSVEGIFGFLTDELAMAKQPTRFWQAAADARIHQRADFHQARGYCRRYLRAVSGTRHSILLEVVDLQPR